MDLSAISGLSPLSLNGVNGIDVTSLTGTLTKKTEETEGNLFQSFLNTAIDNISTTNSYLSDAENEEIKFALGETENTHDLTIALQKASTALQYTTAIRNKMLEAYREIMQMQI
uniref:flagellar hook-basal body complex protein FliE n=1 Tax=Acetatifactor sp. TaxID=1872090 RepID=UPI004055B483